MQNPGWKIFPRHQELNMYRSSSRKIFLVSLVSFGLAPTCDVFCMPSTCGNDCKSKAEGTYRKWVLTMQWMIWKSKHCRVWLWAQKQNYVRNCVSIIYINFFSGCHNTARTEFQFNNCVRFQRDSKDTFFWRRHKNNSLSHNVDKEWRSNVVLIRFTHLRQICNVSFRIIGKCWDSNYDIVGFEIINNTSTVSPVGVFSFIL